LLAVVLTTANAGDSDTAKLLLTRSASPKGAIDSIPLNAPAAAPSGPLFTRLAPEQTGINLIHEFPTNGSFELLQDQGAGAGICVGDFDSDGLADIFVANYDRGNRLYRNLGHWRFEDATAKAGVGAAGRWCGGVTAADLDNDGDLDLFVCVFNGPNLLFINQGNGAFKEQAQARGLDFSGASVMMAFADFDLDGWLDGYLVTHRLAVGSEHRLPRNSKESFSRSIVQVSRAGQMTIHPRYHELFELIDKGPGRAELIIAGQRDLLYRNLGNGMFSNVTTQAGIRGNEIGLAATWWDYNGDGFPDLYVSNDYKGPDHLYRNNRDGTFTDVAATALPHTPWSSMGADAADINNDGRCDFIATEMAGSTHYRRMMIHEELEKDRWFLLTANPRQYARNALYLGTGTEHVMEVAYLAGLATTDWTWSPKFGDLDNDGWIDLFIANGMSRDFINADLLQQMKERVNRSWLRTPPLQEANLAFRNLGDLRFQSVGKEWGLDRVSASYGAALGDLDRDGDLDLVVTMFGEPISVYRNDSSSGQRVIIRLKGTRSNSWGIGAKVAVTTDSGTQTRHLTLASGFMSANEPLVHFGLGRCNKITQLSIQWPSGQQQQFQNIEAGRCYSITEPSEQARKQTVSERMPSWFRRATCLEGIRHQERPYDDFFREPLLPWQLSQLGPGLAVGDVNDDGYEDLYLSGAAGQSGILCIREINGSFRPSQQPCFAADHASEDMAPLFFEADGDGDLDLYVVSGGVECEAGEAVLCDRLYLNDGKGNFQPAPKGALPDERESGSVVAAADLERDGDLDLFVGGRCIPGKYPLAPHSRLLRNDHGRFVDVTEQLAPQLRQTGLVTSALWSDANGDGWLDLLVTHEWGPVKIFINNNGHLEDRTSEAGLSERLGWWNGIAGRDLDGDGDIDYVATNWGLNTKYHATFEKPTLAYLGDFDGAGRAQLVEAYYQGDTLYPARGKNILTAAFPSLVEKFVNFNSYASASLQDIFTPGLLATAQRFCVNTLESGVLLNDGAGHFTFRSLPRLAQAAPSFGLVLTELDGDGKPDLCITQNFHSMPPDTGRMDGGLSLLFEGNGDGSFTPVWPEQSGLVIPSDAKSLATSDLNNDGWPDFIVGINNGETMAFENCRLKQNRVLSLRLQGNPGNPTAIGARVTVTLTKGSSQTAEVHAGGGYLSESTSVLTFGLGRTYEVEQIRVVWPDGRSSTATPPQNQFTVTLKQAHP
jgi:hypothetical protein